jgi:glucose-6-phosphate 1-dehydrogenase
MADLGELQTVRKDESGCEWLESRLAYVAGDLDDHATFDRLREALSSLSESGTGAHNYLFYLATPPSLFGPIVERLGAEGLTDQSTGWRRIVVEKPFGHDLASARALNRLLSSVLLESQIYRIDHYLGKETVQNIMAFRFANGIFEPIWNRRYVDHVQIAVAETLGVEQRGPFYDDMGAMRDMVQNHLFQLLALTAMEPPNSFSTDAVRDERVKVLNGVRPLSTLDAERNVVRGQYGAGTIEGSPVVAYRDEPRVSHDTTTETYVALKLAVDNWRWSDVPFYLRTGKRLARRTSEIVFQFKPAPLMLFRDTAVEGMEPNRLVLRLQPNEGLALTFQAKVPGPRVRLGTVKMDFSYADYFGTKPTTGYELLLYDVMVGDSTHFHRADSVEAGWRIVEPVLQAWARDGNVHEYPAGGWGPPAADELLQRDGRAWRTPGE